MLIFALVCIKIAAGENSGENYEANYDRDYDSGYSDPLQRFDFEYLRSLI